MNANIINELQNCLTDADVEKRMAQFLGPKQSTIAYMLTGLWDGILDAAEDDDPFCCDITEWAHSCVSCEGLAYLYENPDCPVTFQWPCVPLGRDNDRLHGLWSMLKRSYKRMNEFAADAEKTAAAIKEFEAVNGDTRPAMSTQDSITYAIAEDAKWRKYGLLPKWRR